MVLHLSFICVSLADSDHGDVDELQSNQPSSSSKAKKHDSGAADLEKVTDYHEETEIATQDMVDVMNKFGERIRQEKAAKAQREQDLSKVKVKKEDVDLIVNEMEISKSKAERVLREHNGDIVATLTSLTN
ncbi:huntingtin-interacting protein K-like [Ptychodera flava]|uniref:huntingtin-interacting protein K-like n=1 Tax=Ptychodera flava TaxID=63121 RepID=UPI003969CEFF